MPHSDDLAVALARLGSARGAEHSINPVLLRVVVDLFMQRELHTTAELRAFEAMVEPLLDRADPETKRAVAEKLFHHPDTPRRLRDRLLDDRLVVAVDLMRHAVLDDAALMDTAEHGLVTVAMMIASRPNLSPGLIRALVNRQEPLVAVALAGNRDIVLDRAVLTDLVKHARGDRQLAALLAERVADPLDLVPLFAILDRGPRQAILDASRRRHLGRRRWSRPDSTTLATMERLDRLVLSGQWDAFDEGLCGALGMNAAALRPLLNDGTGDVLALCLCAAGASEEMAARVFILGDPAIGQSVDAVRRLVGLVAALAPDAARTLITAMLPAAEAALRRQGMARQNNPAIPARRSETDLATPRRGLVETPLRRRG